MLSYSTSTNCEPEMTRPTVTPGLLELLKLPSGFIVKVWFIGTLAAWAWLLSSLPVRTPLLLIVATPVEAA